MNMIRIFRINTQIISQIIVVISQCFAWRCDNFSDFYSECISQTQLEELTPSKSTLEPCLFSKFSRTLYITKFLMDLKNEGTCPKSNRESVKNEDSCLTLSSALDGNVAQNISKTDSSDAPEPEDENYSFSEITSTAEQSGEKSPISRKISPESAEGNRRNTEDKNHRELKRKKRKEKPDTAEMKPNNFIAVKVGNPEIHQRLKDVQQAIIHKEPQLEPIMVDVAKSHLTLLIMRLGSDEETKKAIDLLRDSYVSFQGKFSKGGPVLEFSTLGHFDNQVLFAVPKKNEGLDMLSELAEDVRKRFEEAGVNLPGYKKFTPHLTIAKMSNDPKIFRKGIRKIPKQAYEEHAQDYFGSQTITELQLCSMTKPKDENGYYYVHAQFDFENSVQ